MEGTMYFSIAGGMAMGAGIWAVIKAAIAAARGLVKRTKTRTDDVVVDKLDKVARYLEEHPEVVDVLHGLAGK